MSGVGYRDGWECDLDCGNKWFVQIVTVICLGRNKDLCSRRSKYKSYGAEGVRSGGRGLSPGVLWQVETVGSWQCDAMRNSAK